MSHVHSVKYSTKHHGEKCKCKFVRRLAYRTVRILAPQCVVNSRREVISVSERSVTSWRSYSACSETVCSAARKEDSSLSNSCIYAVHCLNRAFTARVTMLPGQCFGAFGELNTEQCCFMKNQQKHDLVTLVNVPSKVRN